MKTLQALLFAAATLFSQDNPSLHQIVVEGENPYVGDQAEEIVLKDDVFIPGNPSQLKEILRAYLGKELTEENLIAIRQAISSYYQRENHPYIVASIPEQDVSGGTVRYQIIEGKVGEVIYRGNRYFPSSSLSRFVHTQSGDPIDQNTILNDLSTMNLNPFHYTQVTLVPGSQTGTSNLEFDTQDRFPLRTYAGVDNTGVPFTGNIRCYAGFNWGNCLRRSDILSYQFTTSTYPHYFMSHVGTYTTFLPWHHTVNLWGAFSIIHPKITDFHSEGTYYQGSFRYVVPFRPLYRPFKQNVTFGFDYKGFNSALFFVENVGQAPIISKMANLTQLMGSYQLNNAWGRHSMNLLLELFFSPAEWLANQSNKNYNTLRADAKNRYVYGKVAFGDIYQLPARFSLNGMIRGQVASGPLLPSEQFGLGGYDTVRGYGERDFNADNALCANLEVHFPSYRFCAGKYGELTFLYFVDYGLGYNYQNELTIPARENLIGTGPGLRYLIRPYLTVRADWGFQLHHIPFTPHQIGRIHFGVNAAY